MSLLSEELLNVVLKYKGIFIAIIVITIGK